MNKFKKPYINKVKEPLHKINERITATHVRVTGIENPGIFPINEALQIAQELGLDLIEVVSNATPPVCKVMDYQKFTYEQKLKEKEIAKKNKENNKDLKEVRFTANTDENDVKNKTKQIKDFIVKGHKVKTFILFKGREIQHKERGEILLLKIAEELMIIAKIDQLPKLEGKSMIMMLSPKVIAAKK